MEAATPALRDSRDDAIGIETSRSQVSLTSRTEAVALGPDHDDQRAGGEVGVGEEVGQGQVAVGGETDHLAAGVLEVLERAHEVGRLRDGDPGGRTGRGLPGAPRSCRPLGVRG